MFSGISINEFREKFKTEDDCLQYILDKKLAGGYCCLKCQGDQYGKGREWHYLRCKKYGYDASATAGTLFHKCKLGMLKAFEIAFRVSVRKKGMPLLLFKPLGNLLHGKTKFTDDTSDKQGLSIGHQVHVLLHVHVFD